MPFDNLLAQAEPGVAVFTVQRPQRLNALDASTLDELREAFLQFQLDDSIGHESDRRAHQRRRGPWARKPEFRGK
jgi:hypothetical protein